MMRPMTRRGLGPPEVHAAQVRKAVSNLPAIASLNLIFCRNVTAAGVQALRDTTAAPNLVIKWEETSDVVSTEGSTEGSTDDLEDWE